MHFICVAAFADVERRWLGVVLVAALASQWLLAALAHWLPCWLLSSALHRARRSRVSCRCFTATATASTSPLASRGAAARKGSTGLTASTCASACCTRASSSSRRARREDAGEDEGEGEGEGEGQRLWRRVRQEIQFTREGERTAVSRRGASQPMTSAEIILQ